MTCRIRFFRRAAALLLIAALSLAAGCAGTAAKEIYDLPAQVIFFNVGKADCALISRGNHHWLIDTGSAETAEELISRLRAAGVERLDGVFLSHRHSDHTGGFTALAEAFDMDVLYAPAVAQTNKKGQSTAEKLAQECGIPLQKLTAGERWETDGVGFEVLGPLVLDEQEDNNNSLLLRVTLNGRRLLFTGDTEAPAEALLLAAGTDLRADVLKIAHHGKPDATSEAFAAAVSPVVAIVSADRSLEGYGPENLLRLQQLLQINIRATDEFDGGLLLTLDRAGRLRIGAWKR